MYRSLGWLSFRFLMAMDIGSIAREDSASSASFPVKKIIKLSYGVNTCVLVGIFNRLGGNSENCGSIDEKMVITMIITRTNAALNVRVLDRSTISC